MKHQLFTLLIISSFCSTAQDKAIASIKENFKKQEDCWNKQDMTCYCEAYADLDSVRTISRAGLTYGKENILNDYLKWPKDRMGKLHFDQMNIERISKSHYFVTGRFNLTYDNSEVRSGYFSAIMIKHEGEWKILTDHSS